MKNLKKMSLNLATKELSRKELKGIMAGSGNSGGDVENGKFVVALIMDRHGVKTDHVAINVTIKQ